MNPSHPKILIVEDNEDIRSALRMVLELENFECMEAENGIEALTVLKNSSLPELILLDMLMPKMNGWEFVDEIKKDATQPIANIPIVAVTATTEKVQRTPGEIQAVIRKPLEVDDLLRVVRGILHL